MNTLDLKQYGITGPIVLTNLSTAALYEEAIRYDRNTCVSSTGALVAKRAILLLAASIEDPDVKRQTLHIKPKLVIRESCGSAK